MALTHHELCILKEYMWDLVEQARQEAQNPVAQRYTKKHYTADEALLELLALLDDRVESEGVQLGLSDQFSHQMWGHYQHAREDIGNSTWLITNMHDTPLPKSRIREITYQAFLEYIKSDPQSQPSTSGC